MNLPTKLTIMRIIMTFIIIFILLFPFYAVGVEFPQYTVSGIVIKSEYIVAGILFIIASITDFIDGYLARKNNQVTDLGKMLDAIADKILVNTILIILACQGFIYPIIPVITVLRDTFVDAIKMQSAGKGKVVAAIKTGKIKTASLMIGIVLVLFYNLPFEIMNLNVGTFFLIIGAVMSIISGIEYYNLHKKLIFGEKEEILS
ncbi:MAG: CDP-diacylglycerol--glycerol-3-phosphate 3-phosphatidyltransferase [Bacilli bacterium]|nr:CDP-diacylglycerol--glycerol-3-phosphate 3-phosphatidyltransferase [Bacilli bacterium]